MGNELEDVKAEIERSVETTRLAALGAWAAFKDRAFVPLALASLSFVLLVAAAGAFAWKFHQEKMASWRKNLAEAEARLVTIKRDLATTKAEGERLQVEIKAAKAKIVANDEKLASLAAYYTNVPVSVMVESFNSRTGIKAIAR